MFAGNFRSISGSLLVSAMFLAAFITSCAAQGIGSVTTNPVTINKIAVSVQASLNPSFFPSDSSNYSMFVRTFETASGNNANITVGKLNYRIAVSLDNATLLDQRFASSDGIVFANLVPDQNITGWQINGQNHSPGDQIPVSQSNPVQIRSKILATGGLYHIAVTLEKGSGGLTLAADQTFNLYVSVSQEYNFANVKTLSGAADFKARSYNDRITSLNFISNSTTNSVSLDMPFVWSSQYATSVQLVHLEIEFPKSIAELQANSYLGTVNGVVLPQRALLIDDFSAPQLRIIHIVLQRPTLDLISERMKSDGNVIHAVITPLTGKPKFPLQIQSNPRGDYVFELSWGPAIIQSGMQTTFVMDVLDPKTGDTTSANFDFVLSQNGTDVYKNSMSSAMGIYSQQYTFSNEGVYKLSASNINGGGESAGVNLIIQKGNGTSAAGGTTTSQPSGCLIATAAFGSELTPQVQYLRNFRDQFVMKSESGAAFMSSFNAVYYSFSPQVADYERQQPWLQATVRTLVYPLLGILTLSEKAHYVVGGEAGTMLAGAVASSMIGATYLWPAGAAIIAGPKKLRIRAIWLAVAVSAAAAVMAISWIAVPAALPFTTAAFVVVSAGASAIAAAALFHRIAKSWRVMQKKAGKSSLKIK